MRPFSLRLARVLVFSACALGTADAHASGFPQIKVPPGAETQWVAEDMVHNGVPMRIRRFTTRDDVQSVIDYYFTRWVPPGTSREVITSLGPWSVLARPRGRYVLSVQVRAADRGAEGFLAVSDLGKAKLHRKLGAGFPHLRGTQVLGDSQSRDHGRKARTLVLRNDFSMDANHAFYEQQLGAAGWTKTGQGTRSQDAWVTLFQRQSVELTLVVESAQGGTIVVANLAGEDCCSW